MSTPELVWHKSSYSRGGDGDCIEVALTWRKSSHSGSEGDNCIEVARSPDTVHRRDSQDKEGPQLPFSPGAWAAFVTYARRL
ncbi:DUF397 domain-containing protein [Streptomyces sp. SPB162]|uniref:DUF397 domain-containing protein n=1 Tax=Streptomyces sp. SPB162 TaxID=2940560 RepID=UPI0024050E9C|nr:DUF397 domain-containing protein [Streptomyces sp. SPB162]MDF9814214.1 hypothetical protein [Streptomyces sp. SPB162]